MDEEELKILKFVGRDEFAKGNYYPSGYVKALGYTERGGAKTYSFEVRSEYYYDYYDVKIKMKNNEIQAAKCNCIQFRNYSTCKHVAACLINYKDELFNISQEQKELRASKKILNNFYVEPKKISNIHLKKKLNIEVELEFHDLAYYRETEIELKLRMGLDKLYNLNNKLSRFLEAYDENGEFAFGKNFVYKSGEYYFSREDEELIEFLKDYKEASLNNNFNFMRLSNKRFASLLKILKNKPFKVTGFGDINKIEYDNPISVKLQKDGELYRLSFDMDDANLIGYECKYLIKGDTLYVLPEKIRSIYESMINEGIVELIFTEENLKLFLNGILPIVKDNIVLADDLVDKIPIVSKPECHLYFDFEDYLILGNAKFMYKDREIDYFDSKEAILRDKEYEDKVVEKLLTMGFLVDNSKIYLEDMDKIGEFFEENLEELAKEYEVFTSDKMKKTNVIKKSKVSSSFSIGKDNIMHFDFDLGDINKNEIGDILDSLRANKKYYRMKNGDFLNLEDNSELEELDNLLNDMDLKEKDLVEGSGVIPKYRAIYLDSIKKDKYHIIKTDNLFDELIKKFNSYKDIDISFPKKEMDILRDYQLVGVKWLYNIYKCGFGGILADEMGLGKSIQLIYLIKLIIKENKDAKILIVAPTSLIYNWKNEFDKFGSELKYKVFADTKNVRKQELASTNDINIYITTYGLLREDREIYADMSFSLLAVDEAQNIKNIHAQMTKVVKSINADCKIALTGTPLENSVLELWSIFDFIMPGYLINIMNFQKKYNIKEVGDNDLKRLDNLKLQIKPFILRRKKKDVVKELPDKIENNIYIDLNSEQKKVYVAQLEKTKKEIDELIKLGEVQNSSFKILQLLTRLRQLCIDPKIVYENYKGSSAKIENLVEIVKGVIENGHKILLFTSFKTALDIVNREFSNNGISTYVLNGEVTAKKRALLVDKFNSDDTNVFLIMLKAGGTGLNLTSADVVIHLDLWWNPQVENQATDRAHRIGQKNSVEVIKLICKGTIEERILELQNKKKALSDALIEDEDRDKNIISKLSEDDIKYLLSLDNEKE